MWFDHKFIVQSQSCYQSGYIENMQHSEMDCLFFPYNSILTYHAASLDEGSLGIMSASFLPTGIPRVSPKKRAAMVTM